MVGVRTRDAGSASKTITRIRARDSSNVLRVIQRIRGRDASNALRVLWQFLSANTNRPIITGVGNTYPDTNITTNNATVAPVGGTAPFTYAWTKLDDYASRWTVNSPASEMTSATCADVAGGEYATVTLVCTITDANGATASVNVMAEVQNLALAP